MIDTIQCVLFEPDMDLFEDSLDHGRYPLVTRFGINGGSMDAVLPKSLSTDIRVNQLPGSWKVTGPIP
jgi:hypothetical protein